MRHLASFLVTILLWFGCCQWALSSSTSTSSSSSSSSSWTTSGISKRVGFLESSIATGPQNKHDKRPLLVLFDVRGGAVPQTDDHKIDLDNDDDDDDEEENADDNDNVLFGLEDMDNTDVVAESDFAEDSTLDRTLDAWKKTPPLTKLFLKASAATTLYGYLFNKNDFPAVLSLEWKKILTKMQLWRLLTGFLNFGPFGLGYLMTAHFVWTYMSTLERLSYDKPYDFWIMILFGQLSMVLGYPLLNLSPRFLGHNLSTYLVYIWARYHEGMEVNLFELFNTRAELLPWFFLAQTFLLEGELPILDFLGIAFGHIYHHCKTVGLLRPPKALVDWYKYSDSPVATRIRQEYKQISSDFEMI